MVVLHCFFKCMVLMIATLSHYRGSSSGCMGSDIIIMPCVALLSFSAHSAGASVQVGVTELTILIHSTVHTVRTDRLTQRHSQTNPTN